MMIIDTNDDLRAEWLRRSKAGIEDLMEGIELRGEPLENPTPFIQLIIAIEGLSDLMDAASEAFATLGDAANGVKA